MLLVLHNVSILYYFTLILIEIESELMKNKGVSMSNNIPFIREIVERTSSIKGERVNGDNTKEIKTNVQTILKKQLDQHNQIKDI